MRSAPSEPVVLHILSDSTGNLPQHMLRAFLTQFPAGSFVVHKHTFVDTSSKLSAAMKEIHETGGMVFQAIVSPEAKALVAKECKRIKLPHCDLTGGFVDFISQHSGIEPISDVNRIHSVGDDYLDRIGALEFTLEHDDGLGLATIHDADIVLTGISRTSKTPTSIFLGQQGFRTANVALAMEVDPPAELLRLGRKQVVGLLIDPTRLVELRTSRNTSWSMNSTQYNDFAHISREVAWSRRLFASRNWQTLDVTNHAIEENAGRIINLLGLNLPHGLGEVIR